MLKQIDNLDLDGLAQFSCECVSDSNKDIRVECWYTPYLARLNTVSVTTGPLSSSNATNCGIAALMDSCDSAEQASVQHCNRLDINTPLPPRIDNASLAPT